MPALKFRKKIILLKTEVTYGTDAAPVGASNALLTHGLQIRPLEGDVVNRDVDRPILGNDLSLHVGSHVACEFDVEIAGSGTVDTPPAYAAALLSCGMAETINAATDVQYDPVSTGEDSCTIHLHFDGQKHALVGCRGTYTIALDPKGIPYYHFVFTGLWVDPAATADPTPDFSAFQVPLPVTNDNTATFTVHGGTYNVLAFSYDHANQVVYRNVIGEESVQIVDRSPSGSITIEAPALGTKNWFTTAKANTTGAIQWIHGTAAGGIVQFDASIVQMMQPQYGESDGIRTLQMNLAFIPSDSGDDEMKITTK